MNKKIFTIICCLLLLVSVFSLSVSAFWEAGNADTPRYYSPLNFDFQVFGITADLMPTISYDTNSGYPSMIEEYADGSISRDSFGFSSLASGAMEVSYRLKLSTQESADNFTMKIVGNQGFYDFAKYGIPNITVPSGYTANVNYELHYRFTQAQSFTTDTGKGYILERSYANNHKIPLLFDTVTSDGEEHNIVGDVIVDVYEVVIEFVKDSASASFGDEGYYLWNTVLTDPAGYFSGIFLMSSYDGAEFLYYEFEDYFVVDYVYNDVAYSYEFNKFIFVALNSNPINFRYDDDVSDFGYIVYNFNTDEWMAVNVPNPAEELEDGATINVDDIRCIKFNQVFNTYDSWYVRFGYDTDFIFGNEYGEPAISTFLDYMESNTIYYETNPLQTVVNTDGVTYSFTDGDGGLYVNYTVDRSVKGEYVAALNSYFNLGKSMGGGDGIIDVNFSTWIAKAVSGFFDFELFPGFTFGGIFAVIISILLAVVFLKLFAGG